MSFFNKKDEDKEDDLDDINGDSAWSAIFDPKKSGVVDTKGIDLEKGLRRKKLLIIISSAVVALALAFVGYTIYDQINSTRQEQNQHNEQVGSATPSESSGSGDQSGQIANPAANSSNIGAAAHGSVAASVNGQDLMLQADKNTYIVTFPALTDGITASSKKCELKSPAASCYLGQGKLNDSTVQFYAFRDAKDNSLLYSDQSYRITPSNGSSLAFVREFKGDDKTIHGFVIVFSDQTGVIVTSSDMDAVIAVSSGDSHFDASTSTKK